MSTISADQEQILRDKKVARLQKEGDETRSVRHFESDMWTFCYIVVIFSIGAAQNQLRAELID